jgi:hypothetical protein
MGGSTKRYDTTPAQTSKVRGGIVDYLMGPGGGTSGFGTQGNGTGSPYDRINAGAPAPTQSVDQLGGADSAFFKNMLEQYQPALDQNRATGIAAAKEGAGTLTGSGFANILGSSINRSLGEENATVANIAGHGLDLEQARQQNEYNQRSDTMRSNAQNFLQLLMGQGLAGVSPDTIKTSGGFGALLEPIMRLAGQYLGSRGGPSPTGGTPTGGGTPTPYVPPDNTPSYAYRG